MREKIKGKITKARASVISDDELTDQILSYQSEEIEKGLLTEKECMDLSTDSPLSSDEWEKVSLWARGLVANAQLQKILALLKQDA